jgi:hypothetical protein
MHIYFGLTMRAKAEKQAAQEKPKQDALQHGERANAASASAQKQERYDREAKICEAKQDHSKIKFMCIRHK